MKLLIFITTVLSSLAITVLSGNILGVTGDIGIWRSSANKLSQNVGDVRCINNNKFITYLTATDEERSTSRTLPLKNCCVPSSRDSTSSSLSTTLFSEDQKALPLLDVTKSSFETNAGYATTTLSTVLGVARCGGIPFPAGYHPFGYALTELGEQFLGFDGSKESDVGRFLASLKSGRKSKATLKEQWLEVLRVSKSGQSLRIYKMLDELIKFSLKAGFIR